MPSEMLRCTLPPNGVVTRAVAAGHGPGGEAIHDQRTAAPDQGRVEVADEEAKPQEKSLEMRVAELEDKLSRVHITEEELQAYHKVSALLAGGGGISPGAAPKETAIAAGCVMDCSGGCINECGISRPCIIRQCIIRQCVIRQPIIRACTWECWAECAPGLPGGGAIPGQFGGLGF